MTVRLVRGLVVLCGVSAVALGLSVPGCAGESPCDETASCPPSGGAGGEAGESSGGATGGVPTGGRASGGQPSGGSGSGGQTPGSGGSGGLGGEGGSSCELSCAGAASFCDEDAGACVECKKDSDCNGDLCDTSVGQCVECLKEADCLTPEFSTCDGGACAGCTENAECTHLAATPVCLPSESTCVECVTASDCGGKPCNPLTHTCSAYGQDRRACESCDTDENCNTLDHYCVPLSYQGAERGGYCLKKTPDCARPFFTLLQGRASLSGATGESYCGINETNSTCEATRALLDDVQCPGGQDSECPESGLCRDIGGVATNRCTYKCSVATDCPAGPGSTCGDAPNDYCGFVP